MLDWANVEKLIAEGYVNVQKHAELDLWIYNYSRKCQYDSYWTAETLQSRILGIPHALKVRNNDYLQLIYGINFHRDYEYYLTKRRVDRKIKASIRDYEIHCALTVAESASDRRNLYFAALLQEEYERTLDVRL